MLAGMKRLLACVLLVVYVVQSVAQGSAWPGCLASQPAEPPPPLGALPNFTTLALTITTAAQLRSAIEGITGPARLLVSSPGPITVDSTPISINSSFPLVITSDASFLPTTWEDTSDSKPSAPPLVFICTGGNAFDISGADVVLHNVDISGCGNGAVLINAAQGASGGTVLLDHCNIHDNTVPDNVVYPETESGNAMAVRAQNAKILVVNSIIERNVPGVGSALGAGVSGQNSSMRIVNSTFDSNGGDPAPDDGGAVRAVYGGSLYITNSTFRNTTATRGSAVLAAEIDNVIIRDTLFVNNVGAGSIDGVTLDGGAVYVVGLLSPASLLDCSQPLPPLIIDHCTFINNTAVHGGAILAQGTATIVQGSTFAGNIAQSGGAIYVNTAYINVTGGSTFTSNVANAYGNGGGLYSKGGIVALAECTFTGNIATDVGGGIYTFQGAVISDGAKFISNSAVRGGGMYSEVAAAPSTYTSTIWMNNTAQEGGSVCLSFALTASFDNCTLDNNRATGGPSGGLELFGTNITIANSRFSNNFAPDSGGAVYIDTSQSIIVTNSNFSNNTGQTGGAMYTVSVMVEVRMCNFWNNTAAGNGGALATITGFANITGTHNTTTIGDTLFVGNGAALGGALYAKYMAVNLSNITASQNKAVDSGGAIYADGCVNVTLAGGRWESNACSGYGGVLWSDSAKIIIEGVAALDNTALHGGFMQVFDGEVTITSTVAYNNTAQAGGAIAAHNVGNLSSLNISYCALDNNTAYLGGALAAHGANVTLLHTNFTNNTVTDAVAVVSFPTPQVTGNGGACMLSNGRAYISGSLFVGNGAVGNGGSIFVVDTPIEMQDVRMDGNTAILAGGALFASGLDADQLLVVTGSAFSLNSAGSGGAVALNGTQPLMPLSADMADCAFSSNTATSEGGAFYCTGCSNVTVLDCNFTTNTAVTGGGAFTCSSCATLALSDTSISLNKAASGGGLYLTNLSSPATIDTCSISSNKATGYSIVYEYDAETPGIGGALYLQSNSTFTIDHSTLANNTAQNGGAIFAQGCTTIINGSTTCPLVLRNTTVQDNAAVLGGGGAVYLANGATLRVALQPGSVGTAVSTAGASAGLAIATATACGGNCQAIFAQQNLAQGTSAYGSGIAGPPIALLSQPDNATDLVVAAGLGGGDPLTASFVLYDAWGNIVSSGPSEFTTIEVQVTTSAATQDTCGYSSGLGGSSGPSIVQGLTKQSLNNGRGDFSLLVGACPGTQVNVTFNAVIESTSLANDGTIPSVTFPAIVQRCSVGQASSTDGCSNCTQPFFSFDPAGTICQVCPDNSNCSGSIIIPDNSYWHSHPRCAQIHYCPIADACQRSLQQVAALNTIQLQLSTGNVANIPSSIASSYMAQMCAPGYTGTLCGRCVVNDTSVYAKQLFGTCGLCPPYRTAVAAYLLARLFDLACIVVLSAVAIHSVNSRQQELDEHTAVVTAGLNVMQQAAAGKFNNVQLLNLATSGSFGIRGSSSANVGKDVEFSIDSTQDAPGTSRSAGGEPAGSGPAGTRPAGLSLHDSVDTYHADAQEAYQKPLSLVFRYRPIIEILRDYLQLLGIIRHTGAQRYLSSVVQVIMAVGAITPQDSRSWVSIECLLPTSISQETRTLARVTAEVLLPFVYLALVALVLLPQALRTRHRRQRGLKSAPWGLFLKLSLLQTVLYFYPSLVSSTFMLVSCTSVDVPPRFPGEVALAQGRVWVEDYSTTCYIGAHLVVLLALGLPVLVLIVLGFPLGLLAFLAIHRRRHGLAQPRFWVRYGLLYEEYKSKRFYWGAVMALRQLFLLLAVAAFSTWSDTAQVQVAVVALALLLLMHLTLWPYHTRRFNAIQTAVLCTLLWTMFFIYALATFATTQAQLVVLDVLLVGINAACVLWCLVAIYRGIQFELLEWLEQDPKAGLQRKHFSMAVRKLLKMTRPTELKNERVDGQGKGPVREYAAAAAAHDAAPSSMHDQV